MRVNRRLNLADEEKSNPPVQRLHVEVQGVVQGVGFRPFVYGVATQLGLSGFVGNDSHGVFIELEGQAPALDQFLCALTNHTPPAAYVESVASRSIPVQHSTTFEIVHSLTYDAERTLISPDLCICEACLAELFDPTNRRYRYPFINCTHCGPRFTITRDLPYDRPLTTMADFVMCPACKAEYENPLDRRFHAQPNACPTCGPKLELCMTNGERFSEERAILAAQSLLAEGKIVAVKGLGGFHLACDAMNDQAVQTLRQRKGRDSKPLAVMAIDLQAVRNFAQITIQEEKLLSSPQRPVVLLRKRPNPSLSHLIAPSNNSVGVMLPYTPLHYLLLQDMPWRISNQSTELSPMQVLPPVLVMTSANLSGEPIIQENEEALSKLGTLADAILLHDRPIHMRCDDSVVRIFAGQEMPIRRSRGYTPFPVKLPFAAPPILAVGGELKSTFCLTVGKHAFMSQHIGDMENLETLQAFSTTVDHFKSIFCTQPALIACDLHPGYLSSKWAQEHADGVPLVKVQHHHAHIAALMAEHGLDESKAVIGFSFDGTGYGTDDAIWGGEVMIADYHGFQRVAHLNYVPLPGGNAAIKHPYRTALAHLWAAGIDWEESLPPVQASTETERKILLRQFESGFQTIPTSSMGRLFDAVASLIGLRQSVNYEGQAGIELESIAHRSLRKGYRFELKHGDTTLIDAAPVIRAIVADLKNGVSQTVIAEKFQSAVAELIVRVAKRLRKQSGLYTVALSGGVFQNFLLLNLAVARLQSQGFTVLVHRIVPPNDGGLALGQAVVAAFSESASK